MMEKIEVKWISVLEALPPKGVDVFVLRRWTPTVGENPGKSHQECKVAKRNSDRDLTLNSDTSANCWWDGNRCSFSDSTVHSWAYMPNPKDILVPTVAEIIYSSSYEEDVT
ncbi:hypothetical protein ACET9I_02795 [Aeromonas veronii]